MTESVVESNESSAHIAGRYTKVHNDIDRCSVHAGRDSKSVRLLAVSKTRSIEEIRILAKLGQTDFGENYVVDAIPKIEELKPLRLRWHFVGTVQSNKTRLIAQHFDWVHSLDRASIARRLNDARCDEPLNVCIQVNLDDETQKSGVSLMEAASLASDIQELRQLRLRGLMAIPKAHSDPEESRCAFSTLYQLFQRLKPSLSNHWDTLSMGMTHDYEIAIQEGATLVRLGTAIFGPRE